jgi:hypothetical protein
MTESRKRRTGRCADAEARQVAVTFRTTSHPGACAKRRSALAGHSPRDPSRACARRCRAERADDAFQITKLIRKLLMYLGMGAL